MRHILLLIALVFVPPAAAQVAAVQIDPGMTRVEVIERLGKPATERSSGGFTYLFFINGCERTCGMNDLVTLKGDSVIDAIFRTPRRSYGGRSTSPEQNRSPKANRGPLTITPAQAADSVVMRIVPVDSFTPRPIPPASSLPIGDLTGKTIVPGARPDSLRSSRLPADAGALPDSARAGGPPGRQPPVVRSDTVMNPRPTAGVPRTDSTRPIPPPPSQPPKIPPPMQQPPAT
jgi:hypothetical protein